MGKVPQLNADWPLIEFSGSRALGNRMPGDVPTVLRRGGVNDINNEPGMTLSKQFTPRLEAI